MSISFAHAQDLPAQQGSADNFTGDIQVRVVAVSQEGPAGVGRVTFRRGRRTHWHTHSGEQTLYFLDGHGRVQQRGERASTPDNIEQSQQSERHERHEQ